MNPLAITPAFTGEIQIPESALIEREEVISASKQITGVSSPEELEQAVAVLRNLSALEKVTEQGRTKEKRPFLDFSKLIDSFAAKFIAPGSAEKARITEFVNEWQREEVKRKREEEMEAAKKKWEAEEKQREAQREIEKQRILAEKAKTAAERKKAEAAKLSAQLVAEESALAVQSASIVPAGNTPAGLATRVSYDFEIVDPEKLFVTSPQLWRWKAGEEAFHFDRASLRVKLNSEVPNEYTGWRPPKDAQSVVMSDYGIRVFVSVKTNVRS